jgi:hypothetical protein
MEGIWFLFDPFTYSLNETTGEILLHDDFSCEGGDFDGETGVFAFTTLEQVTS